MIKPLELFEKISLLIIYIIARIIALLIIVLFAIKFTLAFNFLLWNVLCVIFFGILIYEGIKETLITIFDEIKDIKIILNEKEIKNNEIYRNL